MKTTIVISDPLLEATKETARKEGTTLRALVEEGLRLSLQRRERQSEEKRFRLRDASVGGTGLRREVQGAPWETLRDLAYEGHGT